MMTSKDIIALNQVCKNIEKDSEYYMDNEGHIYGMNIMDCLIDIKITNNPFKELLYCIDDDQLFKLNGSEIYNILNKMKIDINAHAIKSNHIVVFSDMYSDSKYTEGVNFKLDIVDRNECIYFEKINKYNSIKSNSLGKEVLDVDTKTKLNTKILKLIYNIYGLNVILHKKMFVALKKGDTIECAVEEVVDGRYLNSKTFKTNFIQKSKAYTINIKSLRLNFTV